MQRIRRFEKCLTPGCGKPGSFARGFCAGCWLTFKKHCQENGSWHRGVETPRPELPHFEYEGNEQALIEQLEKESEQTTEGQEQ